jgi:hypothetical protein
MPLTIDDGTFNVGNSFVTLGYAYDYHELRGNSAWIQKTDEEQEALLVRAFDFLSVQNWASDTFTTAIPKKIKDAQCLAAFKELEQDNALQPDYNPTIKRERIEGVIETEYFGKGETASMASAPPAAVMNLIGPYLKRPGMRMTMVRG